MANVPDDSKSYFTQENLPEPLPPEINIVPSPTGSQVEDGSLRSPNYSPGASGWTINSDGTAEFVGLEATNVKIIQSFPLAENMSAGTLVGVNWEGEVARAARSFVDDATNQFTLTSTSYGGILGTFPYSSNVFIVVYEQTISSTDYFKAVTATISSSSNDVTFGTPHTITSLSAGFYTIASACQVDTGTFVVVYPSQAGSENVFAIAFSYNGTSFTNGSATTITTDNNLARSSCCKADTNKFAFWTGRESFTNTCHGYASVSSLVITVDASSTSVITNITDPATKSMKMAQVGTNKVVMLQCSNGYGAVFTTDGSWVNGTPVDLFGLTGDWTTASIASPAADTFYAHLAEQTSYCTISGTVLTLQAAQTTRTGGQGGMLVHNSVVYDLNTYPTDEQYAGMWRVTQAGSDPILTQISSFKKTDGVYTYASSGTHILAISSSDLSYWIDSMAYNFIGVMKNGETTTSGHNGKVIVGGIADGLTGLIPGENYLVSNGSLTRIGQTATVNTLDDVLNVVKAVSSTQILI